MTERWDAVVIGGGASGMAAAIRAAECGERTLLVERGAMLGRKLAATGNGRCNLMNRRAPKYYGEAGFAEKVLEICGIAEQEAFWHRNGVLLREETQGRVYPMTMQASTVLDALKEGLKRGGVEVRLKTEIAEISPDAPCGYTLQALNGEKIRTRRVIVAAGGAASAKLGGTKAGYGLLERLGYTRIPIQPALCGIKTDRRSVSGLSGIRVSGTISVFRQNEFLHAESGEILFSEDGLSGICVMQCARFVNRCGADSLQLNLKPKELNGEQLRQELKYRRERFPDASPEALLTGIIPAKLAYAVCKQSGLPMRGENIASLEPMHLECVAVTLEHYRMQVTGTRGLEEAQVTSGGISCADFNPRTMESRRHPGLYVTGEMLDVDGDCGGFNLMFAFGSGIMAGGQKEVSK